jgi:type II secretory pathway component GspD/PulD (secretin)
MQKNNLAATGSLVHYRSQRKNSESLGYQGMKKIFTAILIGGLVLQQLAFSQTNATGTNSTAPETATNSPATPAVTNEPTVGSNAAAASVTSTNTMVMSTNQTAEGTNLIAGTSNQMAEVVSTNGVVSTNEVISTNAMEAANIPLIQFSDVPITTAIENLARQASINYLLDPKISYGQPDATGQVKPEPTLSIRWENITAQHALMALLDNYGLQLVEDPKTKISRIAIKEPGALPPLMTKVVQLKYASVSNMVGAVQSALDSDKRSHVVTDARTSQLVVVATEKQQADVDALVNQLDKPTKQVLIETRLIQVSRNPSTSKGVDWSGTLQAQNVAFGNGILSGTTTIQKPGTATTTTSTTQDGRVITSTTAPGTSESSTLTSVIGDVTGSAGFAASTAGGLTPATGFLTADGAKAVISFLNQDADVQIISTPRIVTLDNETANISVTRLYPVFATQAGTQGSPGGSQVNYTNLGTILAVTPRISANDYIWLKVRPEVSSIFATATKTVGGVINQADIYDVRVIETQVLIPNNNTLVMGGLVKNGAQNGYNSVPGLGNIPGLGWAFRHETKSMEKDDLIIFITPTIVQEADYQPAKSKFLQQRPTENSPALKPDTFWNRAKPAKDWSNPSGGQGVYDDSLLQPVVMTTNAPLYTNAPLNNAN